jgi:integrase
MLYKRADSPYWWVRFSVGGRRVRCSAETTSRKEAEAFARRLREREWRRAHTGGRTWAEACARWLREHQHKRSLNRDQAVIRWTLGTRLADAFLADIDRDLLTDIRAQRTGGPATVNRDVAVIRAVLNACVDWGWIPAAPKVPMAAVPRDDPRWLTADQFAALLTHLPPHLRQLARFAVATGLRRANITGLVWGQVDVPRRHLAVPGRASKSGKPIPVPLNASALRVLRVQWRVTRERRRRGIPWVFPYRDEAQEQVATRAWRNAVKAIGMPGFRFHDLRHTWASWHVQAGTPLHALQALGGWSSLAIVQRYGHLDSASLRGYADNVGHDSGTLAGRKAAGKAVSR